MNLYSILHADDTMGCIIEEKEYIVFHEYKNRENKQI